jgi:hypothetical protein
MRYGPYASYQELRKKVEKGDARIAVNHFRPALFLKTAQETKLLLRAAYAMKIVVPAAVSLVLGLTVFPSNLLWVAICTTVAICYLFDVGQGLSSVGVLAAIIGISSGVNLLPLVGLPVVVGYFCSKVWWVAAMALATKEVLSGKETFQNLWDRELVLLVVGDKVYSVSGEGSTKNQLPDRLRSLVR